MTAWHSRSILMACTAMAMLPFAVPAAAQDGAAGQSTELGTIEVKGKKGAASAATDTPLATQTTSEDIARKEIGSIADLGNTTEPGVDYTKRTDGAVIRGLSGPRVATVIDGIPIPYLENFARGSTSTLTNSDGGGSSFDFSSLSALDVLRGADSSRVGSGVLGGALVLRTLEPEDLIEEGRDWGALTKLTYDSEDKSVAGSLAVAGRAGATSALLQGSYKKGHETDNKGTNGVYGRLRSEPNPLDFDQNNILFKLRHDLEGGHRIGLAAERYHRDATSGLATAWTVPTGAGATQYTYPVDSYFGNEKTLRERVSLDYSYVAPTADTIIEAANATAYWQRLTKHAGAEGTQVRVVGGARTAYLRDNALSESAIGFNGGMTARFATGTLDHRVRVGVDLSRFDTTAYMALLPASAAARSQADIPDVDGTRFGFFVDDEISFAGTGFSLTPGLRFDWHNYEPKPSPEFSQNPGSGVFALPGKRSGSRVSPKLLATYQVNPSVELFAQWSAAYRAPTVNELYLNFTNPLTGYAQIGNPDLKPEIGHGIEVGANLGTDGFGGRVTVFHNRYRNFIVAGDLTPDPAYPMLPFGIGRFENIDRVHISGIEIKAHKLFDNGLRLHGALSYVYGKDVTNNQLVPTVAPFKAIAGIGYEQEHWGVDLTGIFVGRYRGDNDAATFDAPAYAIANLTGWWQPEQVKGMRIQAGVYNLFDKTHYDALAVRNINPLSASNQPIEFYSQPGRTFKVSLTHKF